METADFPDEAPFVVGAVRREPRAAYLSRIRVFEAVSAAASAASGADGCAAAFFGVTDVDSAARELPVADGLGSAERRPHPGAIESIAHVKMAAAQPERARRRWVPDGEGVRDSKAHLRVRWIGLHGCSAGRGNWLGDHVTVLSASDGGLTFLAFWPVTRPNQWFRPSFRIAAEKQSTSRSSVRSTSPRPLLLRWSASMA